MRKAKWLGIMSVATAIASIAMAQTPVQKLEQAGRISFRLNNSPYWIRVGVACNIPAFSGGLGDQAPFCKNLTDLNGDGIKLDFQATVNEIVNTIQSTELVNFIGTPVGPDKVRWTARRTFNPPHCTFIAGGVNTWFKLTEVYGDFTMQISEVSCRPDPYNCFSCNVNLALTPVVDNDPSNDENENYMGFNGLLMQGGDCNTGGPIPTCARTYTVNVNIYSRWLPSDVNGDCVVDDADLLAVLFAFGQSGSNLPEDINKDGVVDDADLLTVLFAFGTSC
ncbi:MAG: hypothetical protein ABDI19_12565 [Armatimonadota bacterium]